MAEKRRKTGKTDKWKRKIWYDIYAPSVFGKEKIAETVAEKPNLLEGRKLLVSGRDVSGQIKKQHLLLNFKVDKVQGTNAYTKLVGHEIKPSFLKRYIRRNSSKVQIIVNITTKDKQKLRATMATICVKKITKKQETDIRKVMNDELRKIALKKDVENLVHEFTFGSFAMETQTKVRKIALVKRIEVLKSRVV